jgi:hypothetical protein
VALHLPATINIKQSSQAQTEYKAVTNRALQRASPGGTPTLIVHYSLCPVKPQNQSIANSSASKHAAPAEGIWHFGRCHTLARRQQLAQGTAGPAQKALGVMHIYSA